MKKTAHIVGLSGGKDSAALALALQIYEPRDYVFISNPTGDELPEMGSHLSKLAKRLGQPIRKVTCGATFTELIYRENMIPNFRARWCTRILKIEPTQEFINQFDDAVLYIGLRADEEGRKGADYGVQSRFPFQEWGWGLSEVHSFLASQKIAIPPRTDCAMCFYQRIGEWWDLWYYYPDYYSRAEKIESDIGATFRTPGKDSWPTALKDMRVEFEKGRTPRNAQRQMQLFGERKCRVCTL